MPFAITSRGRSLELPLDQPLVVVTGASGGGKSSILRIFAECIVAEGISLTVIDPSGSFPVEGLSIPYFQAFDEIEAHVTWLEQEFLRRRDLLAKAGAISFLEIAYMPVITPIFDESQDLFDAESVAEKSEEGQRLRALTARINRLHRRQRKCGLCTIMAFTTGSKSSLAVRWTNATVKLCTYLEESESRAFAGDTRANDQTLRAGRFLMMSPATLGWVYGRTLSLRFHAPKAATRAVHGWSRRRRP